jgi:diguanylate cyclase (GGDEF)-like protein
MRRSIAIDTLWFIILTLSLVLLTVFATHFVLSGHAQKHFDEKLDTDFDTYEYALETHVEFYRSLLKGLAQRQRVKELLDFPDVSEAFSWAQGYRKLLPGSVGLALVTSDGEVLGDERSLYIGPACSIDIQRLAHGEAITSPAVHRDNKALEHFDLMEPVTDQEDAISGYIFASFSLSSLSGFANNLIRDGHRMTLNDANENLIFTVGTHDDSDHAVQEISRRIPLGSWTMTVSTKVTDTPYSAGTLGTAATLVALLIGAGVIILSRRVSSGLINEIKVIQSALDEIAEGKSGIPDIHASFKETRPVMDAVKEISYRIQQQKTALLQLSETDDLTGLMNRRSWTSELKKLLALADRGTSVHIMALDLDGFKEVNDRLGHAAGDKLLKQFAGCLNECTRQTDCAARIGGDEFMLSMVNSSADSGEDLFSRLQSCFQRTQACEDISASVACTLSAGMIQLELATDTDVNAAMQRVDAELYQAKQAGKNRISIGKQPAGLL